VSAPANHQNASHQSTQALVENPFLAVLVGFSIVVGVLLAGRQFIPKVLHEVVRLRNRELFLITLVLICLGTAAITAAAGLSLAIGAFIAGLALSESEYGHQAFAEVLPFRDTLASLFFVSVGMLLDISFVFSHFGLVCLVVFVIVLLKVFATAIPAMLAGFPVRTSLIAGGTIAQVGEFSFVLGSRGVDVGLLTGDDYQTFLAAAVITMAAAPLLTNVVPQLCDWLGQVSWFGGIVS